MKRTTLAHGLLALPARDQAACVMLAAQRCEPLARQWFERQKLSGQCRGYVESLARRLTGRAPDKELEKAARPPERRLNREIEYEDDLPGAAAASPRLSSAS